MKDWLASSWRAVPVMLTSTFHLAPFLHEMLYILAYYFLNSANSVRNQTVLLYLRIHPWEIFFNVKDFFLWKRVAFWYFDTHVSTNACKLLSHCIGCSCCPVVCLLFTSECSKPTCHIFVRPCQKIWSKYIRKTKSTPKNQRTVKHGSWRMSNLINESSLQFFSSPKLSLCLQFSFFNNSGGVCLTWLSPWYEFFVCALVVEKC